MATFTMYRCDACGVTSDQKQNFQKVQFHASDESSVSPMWLVCDDGQADCYVSIWARRHEVSNVATFSLRDYYRALWPDPASTSAPDEEEDAS